MSIVFPSIAINDLVRGDEFNYKSACKVASTPSAAWALAYSAPTLTITGMTSSGGSIGQIDGINTLAVGDRVLLKDMGSVTGGGSSNSYNGIWEITGGSATTATLIRTYDLQEGDSTLGVTAWVQLGTAQAGTAWISKTNTTVASGSNSFTFTQYDVTNTLVAGRGGTGVSTFGGTNTLLYTTAADTLSSIATANNAVLVTSAGGVPSISTTLPAAVVSNISHGGLAGLTADDHPQYALLAGRTTGQVLIGGTAAAATLTLTATSNVTPGSIILTDPTKVSNIDTNAAGTLTIGGTTATKLDLSRTGITAEVRGPLTVASTIDRVAAGTLTIGGTTATGVTLGATAIPTTTAGLLRVTGGSGFGIDTAAAGTLVIGETVATKVEIAAPGIVTEAQGPLNIQGALDTISATALSIGGTTANKVNISRSGVTAEVLGPLTVASTIDTAAAGTLTVGGTTATKVDISRSGVTAEVQGPLTVASSIDRAAAGILTVGATTATEVQLGSASILTRVMGNLYVTGTTTTVDSEIVNIADNFLYLNAGYTTNSAEAGGLVVNYLPTTTTTTVTTGGFATTSTVNTVGAATFAAGDFIQVSGAANPADNGIYEVLSHAANVLTIDTTPTESWAQNNFVVNTTAQGTITKVNVSVMRANTSGDWQVAKGSATPLTYSNLATASQSWSYQVISAQVSVTSTVATTFAYFPWDNSVFNPSLSATATFTAWIDTGANRATTLVVHDGTSVLGTISVPAATAAGIFAASFTAPTSDRRLELRCNKNSVAGTNPQIFGITFQITA